MTGSKIFGIQVEANSDECTGSLNDTSTGEDTSVKRFVQTTVGSYPSGSNSLAEWSQQLQEMALAGKLL